jgi:hypothetical protein
MDRSGVPSIFETAEYGGQPSALNAIFAAHNGNTRTRSRRVTLLPCIHRAPAAAAADRRSAFHSRQSLKFQLKKAN